MKSIEHRQCFNHSLEIWEHAPSFWIVCNISNNTPRNTFHSKKGHQYNVKLQSMTGVRKTNKNHRVSLIKLSSLSSFSLLLLRSR